MRAAGNQGSNIDKDKEREFLAPYSNVLIVGGTTRDGTLSPLMNFGKLVGIAAPSVDMVFPSLTAMSAPGDRVPASPPRLSRALLAPSCPRNPN